MQPVAINIDGDDEEIFESYPQAKPAETGGYVQIERLTSGHVSMSFKHSLLLLLLSGLTLACGRNVSEHRIEGVTMGTYYLVKIADAPKNLKTNELQDGMDSLLHEINRSMSTYDKDSELSRINRSRKPEPIPISPGLYTVLNEAVKISRLSNGAFDITVGPLVNLWGFGPELRDDTVPASVDIQLALARVGMDKIELSDSDSPAFRKLHPEVYLDLSAIAKGYGVDRLAEHLEIRGIKNYMVEIGGEMRVKGVNARGKPWRIAIEEPSPAGRNVFSVIAPGDRAVATSGDYRNYFEWDGRRYSHTIDPRNGRPVDHALASVTVLANNCMHADAMATALMVLGPKQGYDLAVAEKLPV
ncbi:MAG TPA: FAD:protein FMN transferase, partial [Gammaproteobacteria bacterium]